MDGIQGLTCRHSSCSASSFSHGTTLLALCFKYQGRVCSFVHFPRGGIESSAHTLTTTWSFLPDSRILLSMKWKTKTLPCLMRFCRAAVRPSQVGNSVRCILWDTRNFIVSLKITQLTFGGRWTAACDFSTLTSYQTCTFLKHIKHFKKGTV